MSHLADLVLAAGWLAIGLALAWSIRDNRRRQRAECTARTMRAWVNNRGKWFD